MKRILSLLLLLTAVSAVIWVFYTFSRERLSVGDPGVFLPDDAGLIVRVDRYIHSSDLPESTPDLRAIGPCALELKRQLGRLDSLYEHSGKWKKVLSSAPVWMVFPSPQKPEEWYIAVGLDLRIYPETISGLSREWAGGDLSEETFEDAVLYRRTGHILAFDRNCMIISPRLSVVEGVILKGKQDAVPTFIDALSATSSTDSEIHIYLKDRNGRYALDNPYAPTMTWMAGYFFPDSSQTSLSANGPAFSCGDILPSSTLFVESWSFENAESDRSERVSAEEEKASVFWNQAWVTWGDSCQCDLNEALYAWRNGESGIAVLSDRDSLSSPVGFAVIKDSADALASLRPLLADSTLSPAGWIYRIRFPEVFRRYVRGSLLVEPNYLLRRGKGVFVAANQNVLRLLSAGSPLSGHSYWSAAHKSLEPRGGMWRYQAGIQTAAFPEALIQWAGDTLAVHMNYYDAQKQSISVWTPGSATGPASSGQSPSVSVADTLSNADAVVSIGGDVLRQWVVRNHLNNDEELLVMGGNGLIYLVDPIDGVQWSYKTDGPVQSEVVQVDALRNGKLQYVFNTRQSIYAIDRTGKDIPGFPVRLKSPASSPLKVADYDNDRNYRLLIGCEDGTVQNYSIEGQPTKGWRTFSAATPVRVVDHVRLGREDYLLVWSGGGKMALLRRNGELREEMKDGWDDYSGKGYAVYPAQDIRSTRLLYHSSNGDWKIRALGEKGAKTLLKGGASGLFALQHIHGGPGKEIIQLSGKQLRIINADARDVLTTELPAESRDVPAIISSLSGGVAIGILLADGTYSLVDLQGRMMDGFPKTGIDHVIALRSGGTAHLYGWKEGTIVLLK